MVVLLRIRAHHRTPDGTQPSTVKGGSMRVNLSEGRAEVVLSERNLKTMVRAYELGLNPDLIRKQEDGTVITIHIESDEEHYKDASPERREGSKEIQRLLA